MVTSLTHQTETPDPGRICAAPPLKMCRAVVEFCRRRRRTFFQRIRRLLSQQLVDYLLIHCIVKDSLCVFAILSIRDSFRTFLVYVLARIFMCSYNTALALVFGWSPNTRSKK